jgi:hypothetical protein
MRSFSSTGKSIFEFNYALFAVHYTLAKYEHEILFCKILQFGTAAAPLKSTTFASLIFSDFVEEHASAHPCLSWWPPQMN